MSCLNSLTIRGIRSFQPDVDQTIDFQSPLTILLGPNGSGKTTIIESLKYVTTGNLPPRADGTAFVHDRKISDLDTVEGQIELDLQNVNGYNTTLSRSVRVSKQKVVGALGVSKAVLNNVLLCHQDDSTWPLSEAGVLKDRFDEIFDTKKYIKLSDGLKTIINTKESIENNIEKVLPLLEDLKNVANDKRQELRRANDEIISTEKEIDLIKRKLSPIEDQLKRVRSKEEELIAFKSRKESFKIRKQSADEFVKEISRKIKKNYQGSDAELNDELRSFQQFIDDKKLEKKQIERQKKEEEKLLSEKCDERNSLSNKKGQLEAELNLSSKIINEIAGLMNKTAEDYDITYDTTFPLSNAVFSFNTVMYHLLDKRKRHLDETIEGFKQEQDKLDELHEKTVNDLAALNETIKIKNEINENNLSICNDFKTKLQELNEALMRQTEFKQYQIQHEIENIENIVSNGHQNSLKELIQSMENIIFEKGKVAGKQDLYKELIENIHEKRCCAICSTNFSTENEVTSVTTEVISNNGQHLSNEQLRLSQMEREKRQQLKLLQESVEKCSIIQLNIDRLNKDMAILRTDLESSYLQLKPINEKLAEYKERGQNLKQSKNEALQKLHSEINILVEKLNLIKYLISLKENLESNNSENLLSDCLNAMDSLEIDIVEKDDLIRGLSDKIMQISDDLGSPESKFRYLQDNVDMRSKMADSMSFEQQIENCCRNIEKMESFISNFDVDQLQKDVALLTRQLGEQEGAIKGHNKTRDTVTKELSKDRYKNAQEKYDSMAVEIYYSRILVDDFEKMKSAVGSALLDYHSCKMTLINKTIRRLWNKVYKSGDIDYIEILAEDFARNVSAVTKRNSYNYRVVMYVNGHALDMRGRCSAGQKVLASTIIRIALAEIFCAHCGFLALDEPTTNLDAENSRSLAEAMSDLIQDRIEQKNFQLLLITHDKDFVSVLAALQTLERYYYVSKNQHGFSRLVERRANDLIMD